ncbi:hypothetical protein ABPG77_001404 [Micractinium sp. CCAP 211/92]
MFAWALSCVSPWLLFAGKVRTGNEHAGPDKALLSVWPCMLTPCPFHASDSKNGIPQLMTLANIQLLALVPSRPLLLLRRPLRAAGTVEAAVGKVERQRQRKGVGGKGPAPQAMLQVRIEWRSSMARPSVLPTCL